MTPKKPLDRLAVGVEDLSSTRLVSELEKGRPKNKPPGHSLGRKTGGALFWNIAFLPLKAGLGLVVSLVIVKLFPQDAYAALAAVTAVLSTLGLFVDLGIERALPRFVNEIETQHGRPALRRFLATLTIIKLGILDLVILAMVLAAQPLSSLFGWKEEGPVYLALVSLLLVLGALYDICTQLLYSLFKQKVTNLLDIVVTILNPTITLILVGPFGLRVYGVVFALLLTTLISVGIAGWQAWLASRDTGTLPVKKTGPNSGENGRVEKPRESLAGRFIRYAALMYFFNISAWFYDVPFAVLVFTFYKEFTTVALVRLVYSFIKTILKNLLSPFVGVQTPLFSSIHAEGKKENLQAAYAAITKLQIFILVPGGIGAIILANNLLELLIARKSGEAVLNFSLVPTATWAMILTILFTFGEALISVPMVILMVYEYYREVILARTLPLLAGPLLILAAAVKWDVVVAVTIMGLMAVSSRVMAMATLQKKLGLRYPVSFLVKVVKAAFAFAIPLQILILFLPVRLDLTLAFAGAGVIIFYLAFKFLGGFDQEDKQRLQALNLPLRKYIIRWL